MAVSADTWDDAHSGEMGTEGGQAVLAHDLAGQERHLDDGDPGQGLGELAQVAVLDLTAGGEQLATVGG